MRLICWGNWQSGNFAGPSLVPLALSPVERDFVSLATLLYLEMMEDYQQGKVILLGIIAKNENRFGTMFHVKKHFLQLLGKHAD